MLKLSFKEISILIIVISLLEDLHLNEIALEKVTSFLASV